MAIKRFRANEAVNERSDAQYECAFVESSGAAIDDAAIQTITATLSDVNTGTILNSRDGQNVKNANGGTLAADGTFTLQLGALDNTVHTATAELEEHRLVLEVTFTRAGGGTGHLNHEVRFYIAALAHVP